MICILDFFYYEALKNSKCFLSWLFSGSKASAGKLVHMKVVDDKLRIIDDVPSSAVEMAVKEKVSSKLKTLKQKDEYGLNVNKR